MKSRLLHLLFVIFICNLAHGQIKIGDNPQNIDPSSVLELESSTRALVITRVDSLQMNAIVPSRGALIYNTDTACVHYYDGSVWVNLCSTLGLSFTANSVVNDPDADPTIVITRTGDNFNFEVAPNSIRSSQIVDGGVNGVDIQNNSIGNNKLADDSVGSNELQDNSVTDAEMDYTQVTLSDFTNDAGFITGINIVSPEPNNSIFDNGGAYYDDSPLLTAIGTNAANIAADGDTDSGNEIQNLSLTGDQLGISGSNTVTLPTSDGSDTQINPGSNVSITGNGTIGNPYTINAADEADGSVTNEIQDLSSPDGSVIITPTGPNSTDYLLTVLPTAGADGSETIIDATLSTIAVTGIGTLADPYILTDPAEIQNLTDVLTSGASAGNLQINDLQDPTLPQDAVTKAYVDAQFAGGVDLFDPVTISGSGIAGDEYTLADDGVSTIKILDENVTPAKIEAGGNGQILTTDAAGDVIWATAAVGGTTELADQLTIVGDGQVGTEFEVADDGITPEKIQAGADGQVLTTDAAGDVIWAAAGAGGSTELADQLTIVGDGQVGSEFEVNDGGIGTAKIADDAVITIKIADDNVTPEKIAPGANGEVLTTDAAGDVVWAVGGAGGSTELADQVTIVGNGQVGSEFEVNDDGITPAKLEAGTNGQFLTTDAAGDVLWTDVTLGTTEVADQLTIVGDGQVGSEFQVADNGITTLQLAANAVTATEIADDNVTPEKLEPGTPGQFLTTDAVGDVIWINAPPGGSTEFADMVTIDGDGQPGTEFGVVDNGITTLQLADNAVTTLKINDGAVTTPKLADVAVTTLKIANDAVTTAKILDENVTVEKIAAGTDGQFLRTDAAGDVIWTDVTLGTTEVADQITIVGDGQATPFEVNDGGITTPKLADDAVTTIKILDDNVTPAKLEAGADGELLTTNAAGDVVWAPAPTGGTTEFADQITIVGDGTPGDAFRVADGGITTLQLASNAVTTVKIADANVTPAKLAIGTADQYLRTDPTGTFAEWANFPAGSQNLTEVLTAGSSAGNLQINDLADPTLAQDAATKAYVDTEIAASDQIIVSANTPNSIVAGTDGGALYDDPDNDAANEIQNMSEVLTDGNDGGGLLIKNIGTPVDAGDATTKAYVDSEIAASDQIIVSADTPNSIIAGTDGGALYDDPDNDATNELQNIGEVLSDGNDGGGLLIKNIGTPVDPADATTKAYVDAEIAASDQIIVSADSPNSIVIGTDGGALYNDPDNDAANELQNIGEVLTDGNDGAGLLIKNIGTPVDPADATTKAYVDAEIAASDQIIVSADSPNSIVVGSDGGALYDDPDNDATNELQNIGEVLTDGNDGAGLLIKNIGTPVDPADATTKAYVDAEIAAINQDDDITAVTFDGTDVTVAEGATTFSADLSALEESADITAEETRALAAELILQNDIDQNETDADTAIAALQTDVDQNEVDSDAGIAVNAAAIVALDASKENTANKSSNVALGNSNTLFPTQGAVKTYVDALVGPINTDDDITGVTLEAGTNRLFVIEGGTQFFADLSSLEESADIALRELISNKSSNTALGNSNSLFPTQNAVKTYVDNQISAVPVINLSTQDLTQTGGENRSYNLNGGQLRFLGSGNIGIGTTNPLVKFHVLNGQIRASTFSSGDGTETLPAYRFTDEPSTGMYRITANDRLGFSVEGNLALSMSAPTASTTNVTVSGSLNTSIRSSGNATVTIGDGDYTVIVNSATLVNLPPASGRQGRIYIIKKTTPIVTTISSYVNSLGTNSTTLPQGVTQLQSDGSAWQQIN